MQPRREDGTFARVHSVNDHFLDCIQPEQAWFLGLMAADGYIRSGRYIHLSQSGVAGKEVMETVSSLISYSGPIRQCGDVYSIDLTSIKLGDRLKSFGIVQNKSLTYSFPPHLEINLVPAFLRGYITGDGTVAIYRDQRKAVTCEWLCVLWVGTELFIRSCYDLLPTRGRLTHIKRAKNLWEIRFNGRHAVELGRWLWSDEKLPELRKDATYRDFVDNILPNRRYTVYSDKKDRARFLLGGGMPPMLVAKEVGVPFQTIYKWMAKDGRDKS